MKETVGQGNVYGNGVVMALKRMTTPLPYYKWSEGHVRVES